MTAMTWASERRVVPDRRAARRFRIRERRRGYDRRSRSRVDATLVTLADLPRALALSAAFAALYLFDLLATTLALGRGAVELNPVMAALLGGGAGGALALKVTVTAAVVAGFLAGRRYRSVALGMVGVSALLAVLAAYHGLNLAASG